MAEHGHGHSTAAWTAVTLLLVGAFRDQPCRRRAEPCGWPSSASSLVVVGPIAGKILSMAGLGQEKPTQPARHHRGPLSRAGSCPPPQRRPGPALTAPARLGRRRAASPSAPSPARDPHVHGTWGFCVLPQPHRPAVPRLRRPAGRQRPRPRPRGRPRWRPNGWVVLSLVGLAGWWGAWVAARLRGAPAPLRDHAVRLSLLWAGGFLAFGVLRLLPPFAGLQPAP